jgi:hypothetical protein
MEPDENIDALSRLAEGKPVSSDPTGELENVDRDGVLPDDLGQLVSQRTDLPVEEIPEDYLRILEGLLENYDHIMADSESEKNTLKANVRGAKGKIWFHLKCLAAEISYSVISMGAAGLYGKDSTTLKVIGITGIPVFFSTVYSYFFGYKEQLIKYRRDSAELQTCREQRNTLIKLRKVVGALELKDVPYDALRGMKRTLSKIADLYLEIDKEG